MPRKLITALPMLLMGGGMGVAALALALDLVGLGGAPGIGGAQFLAFAAGGVLSLAGSALDLALGTGRLCGWFADRFTAWPGLGRFAAVLIQLALLVLVMHQYQIESRAFYHNITLLALIGFPLNHFLPPNWRLPFFLLLSLVGIFGVLGPGNATWLVGIALVLIALCHIPAPFGARVLLVLAAGAALTAMRAGWWKAPVPGVIWPILGSMFMFRLIVFLYDLKHQKDRAPATQTLSYFFLLPNVVFPLFPVVDYKTFRRTYYDAPWAEIYQRGILWMFRGLTHLLLYRLINYYFVLAPADVTNVVDLVRFLTANFLLYLRVSGQFHIIIGMLHLFGFHLPETNNKYCLSSSFTDFWRRINIYWKDFMMKVFYYPAYFKLQKLGATPALLLATTLVFVVTWFLHACQWFWLRGSFLLTAPDVLFWTILGLLMLGNTVWEAKRGRKRTLGKTDWSPGHLARHWAQVAGTFATILILWSLWSRASVADWLALFSVSSAAPPSAQPPPAAWGLTLGIVALVLAVSWAGAGRLQGPAGLGRQPLAVSIALIFCYLLASPFGYSRMQGKMREVVGTLRVPRLSQRETALLRRGYYEELGSVNLGSALADLYMKRPDGWTPLIKTEAARTTKDYIDPEHVPSVRIVFLGEPYSTNRWGMRDKDYELEPSPGSYRVAVLGASQVVGHGVGDNETFESRLEELLNAYHRGDESRRFELLNFAYGGYSPIQQMVVLERKVLPFRPHALFYFGASVDPAWAAGFLAFKVTHGVEPPYEFLRTIVQSAQVGPKTSLSEAERLLQPFAEQIVSLAFRHMVETCQSHGILPVYIQIPNEPGQEEPAEELQDLRRLAAEAGFVVVDITNVFDGMDGKSLQVAEWDRHPNQEAHRLMAERLYRVLLERPEILGLSGSPKAPVPSALSTKK